MTVFQFIYVFYSLRPRQIYTQLVASIELLWATGQQQTLEQLEN